MRLIILDTETTGLSPAEGRIVEIAAVEMLDGKPTGREFHHMLNPECPISEEISEIIGINDAMVADKPAFADIAQAFIDFVGDDKLVVHRAEFDKAFLDQEFFNIGLDWPHLSKPELWIDTLAYFEEKHPGERCSLDALCERYQIQKPEASGPDLIQSAKMLGALYITVAPAC
jgi:DNA polymerase-3 subunit epsilon